nr:putative lysine-specific demethylase JMJ16 isoform X1 [Ipomoea trifida]
MHGHRVPPGFVSLTSFSLEKAENGEDSMLHEKEAQKSSGQIDSTPGTVNVDLLKVSARRNRSWIVEDHTEHLEKGYDTGDDVESLSSRAFLPKGVIRGCPSCANCQKVVARWRAEESCMPLLEEAPVFHPTEEEFEDTLNYVASILPRVEHYGVCRIVPPTSWEPPSLIEEKATWETSKFVTQIQQIDELGDLFLRKRFHRAHLEMRNKRRISSSSVQELCDDYRNEPDGVDCLSDIFEFESGPEFTLQTFNNYADDFKSQYFSKRDVAIDSSAYTEPSIQSIEGEYWRIIEKPTDKLEVLRGAGVNIDASVHRNELPVKLSRLNMPKNPLYVKSGWNLTNTSMLQGSLLRYDSCSTSSISYPQVTVGMCFSSNFWRIEEHHLYSLCYMHLGAPKMWYVIPQQYCFKFEEIVKKRYPELSEHPWLLLNIATQISPSTLISEGIPVYRCVQYPKEFVIVLPGSYHSEFDCGFNCSEMVNFAPFDWLPYGQLAVEQYSELRRKTSISYDKLLLRAVGEAIEALWKDSFMKEPSNNLQWKRVCGKDGILTKALKARVKSEGMRQNYLCNTFQTQVMEKDFDANTKRECVICYYDLHLSAVGCECSPGRYTCLRHAKLLCSCAWSSRFLLYRYEMSELKTMVEALEGKLSAVHRWGKEKLGLTLHSQT